MWFLSGLDNKIRNTRVFRQVWGVTEARAGAGVEAGEEGKTLRQRIDTNLAITKNAGNDHVPIVKNTITDRAEMLKMKIDTMVMQEEGIVRGNSLNFVIIYCLLRMLSPFNTCNQGF